MIFAFEQMSAALDLVPLAARRALDAAGCKLSLEAWRRLPIGARRALVEAGAGEVVNTRAVRAWLARHKASFDRLAPASDPPVDAAPDDLTSALGHEVADSTWRALTPIPKRLTPRPWLTPSGSCGSLAPAPWRRWRAREAVR